MQEEHSENLFTELLKLGLVVLLVVLPIRFFVAQPFLVSGSSMVPTFLNDQYLIIDEISYRFEAPKRGDVIVFKYPKDPSQFFIKRIIGLPGETVTISNATITITKADGTSVFLPEPYIKNRGNGSDKVVVLPPGQYFVMGDNRPESSDSRTWGTMPRQNIVGRVLLRLYPPQTIGIFPGSTAEQQ